MSFFCFVKFIGVRSYFWTHFRSTILKKFSQNVGIKFDSCFNFIYMIDLKVFPLWKIFEKIVFQVKYFSDARCNADHKNLENKHSKLIDSLIDLWRETYFWRKNCSSTCFRGAIVSECIEYCTCLRAFFGGYI